MALLVVLCAGLLTAAQGKRRLSYHYRGRGGEGLPPLGFFFPLHTKGGGAFLCQPAAGLRHVSPPPTHTHMHASHPHTHLTVASDQGSGQARRFPGLLCVPLLSLTHSLARWLFHRRACTHTHHAHTHRAHTHAHLHAFGQTDSTRLLVQAAAGCLERGLHRSNWRRLVLGELFALDGMGWDGVEGRDAPGIP